MLRSVTKMGETADRKWQIMGDSSSKETLWYHILTVIENYVALGESSKEEVRNLQLIMN